LGLPAPPGALGPAAPPLGLPVVAAARADAMAAASISARPTRVLAFLDMVSEADLVKDEEYNEIVADIQEETSKYGKVQTVVVPRPSTSGPVRGVGKVFVEFQDVDSAINARNKIEGRSFGGRPVVCAFITEEAFAAKAF
jgi:splicing factor U2AF subunit